MVVELRAVVKGDVQGVSFRRTVKLHAESLHLFGYARNLENGDVEISLQGSKVDLESFLKELKEHPGRAKIDSISVNFQEKKKTFYSFEII